MSHDSLRMFFQMSCLKTFDMSGSYSELFKHPWFFSRVKVTTVPKVRSNNRQTPTVKFVFQHIFPRLQCESEKQLGSSRQHIRTS